MPDKEKHVDQANHNNEFWNSLNSGTTPYLDWVVSAIFYEAVHWVEAFLATKKINSGTHAKRRYAMQIYDVELGSILSDFDIIKYESENARYRCYKHTLSDVQNDIIPRLINIREHIKTKL